MWCGQECPHHIKEDSRRRISQGAVAMKEGPGRALEKAMYTGTMMEQLFAAVERAENLAANRAAIETAELERLYLAKSYDVEEQKLLGVA
jgi:hypothetical protein